MSEQDIVTDEQGRKTSRCDTRLDLVPPHALLKTGDVLAENEPSHGPDNWRKYTSREHLNRAIVHAYKHIAGRTDKEHLAHCAARMLMALEMYLEEQSDGTRQ